MKSVLAISALTVLLVTGVAHADVAAGKAAYAARGCIGCHGVGGVSVVSAYPSLKGKSADYVREKLTGFRSGALQQPVMNAMSASLKDADIENIADYIGSLE